MGKKSFYIKRKKKKPNQPGFSFLPNTFICSQKESDGVQRDVGRVWRRHVPGCYHHPYGNAKDPTTGCWQTWWEFIITGVVITHRCRLELYNNHCLSDHSCTAAQASQDVSHEACGHQCHVEPLLQLWRSSGSAPSCFCHTHCTGAPPNPGHPGALQRSGCNSDEVHGCSPFFTPELVNAVL